jgi:hypothetical protein
LSSVGHTAKIHEVQIDRKNQRDRQHTDHDEVHLAPERRDRLVRMVALVLDAVLGEVADPGEGTDHRKADNGRDDDGAQKPLGHTESRRKDARYLDEDPAGADVEPECAKHLTAAQLAEKADHRP